MTTATAWPPGGGAGEGWQVAGSYHGVVSSPTAACGGPGDGSGRVKGVEEIMQKMLMMAAAVLMTAAGAAAGQTDQEITEELRRRGLLRDPECTADDGTADERLEAGTLGSGCFELWTRCGEVTAGGPAWVTVDENDIGLRADDIENAVESRLRAAGVYRDYGGSALDLRVSLLDRGAYMIGLYFYKTGGVLDNFGFMSYEPTWRRTYYGLHGGQASVIMEQIRRFFDEFVNHFLRVNGPACRLR